SPVWNVGTRRSEKASDWTHWTLSTLEAIKSSTSLWPPNSILPFKKSQACRCCLADHHRPSPAQRIVYYQDTNNDDGPAQHGDLGVGSRGTCRVAGCSTQRCRNPM